jgi:hypothetical protein
MMAVFRFRFASFRFEAKRMAVFCFLFASFRFEAKMMAVFFILFRFVFALFHFRFASDLYVSHRCETSKKCPFFRIEAKKISLPFRFISLRSENDGAPYFRWRHGLCHFPAFLGWIGRG